MNRDTGILRALAWGSRVSGIHAEYSPALLEMADELDKLRQLEQRVEEWCHEGFDYEWRKRMMTYKPREPVCLIEETAFPNASL